MGILIERIPSSRHTTRFTQKWTGEKKTPSVHPSHATTEEANDRQEMSCLTAVSRMMDIMGNGKVEISEEDFNYCVDYNAEKLGMDREDVLSKAEALLGSEEE